jgi:hypothetical protein
MAALLLLEKQKDSGSSAMSAMPGMHETAPAEVTFPYGFPEPGDYRMFVQIKRSGHVQTGVFDAHVGP